MSNFSGNEGSGELEEASGELSGSGVNSGARDTTLFCFNNGRRHQIPPHLRDMLKNNAAIDALGLRRRWMWTKIYSDADDDEVECANDGVAI